MPETLTISNTSPLLYLHLINHLELLLKMYETVIIPPAVAAELAVGIERGFDVPDPTTLAWLEIVPVRAHQLIPVITDLGAGEAEVIGLALENSGSRVILDDMLGRRIAELHNLTVTGTVGVVLKAKQTGHISKVEPILVDLRQAGLWLSESLVNMVLSEAGELN